MIDQLLEKFLGATGRSEIFVNPSKREMKDLMSASGMDGIRFVLDTDTKKVIVWTGNVTHADMFRDYPTLIKGFNHGNYYMRGTDADHIFTGAIDKWDNIDSDSWFGDFKTRASQEILDNMKLFVEKDLSWAKRYIDTKKIDKLVVRAIELVDDKLELKRNPY